MLILHTNFPPSLKGNIHSRANLENTVFQNQTQQILRNVYAQFISVKKSIYF